MVRKEDIFPIGIGTWNIDCENIEKEIPSLMYSFSHGQNYLSLYMLYNHGEVVKKVKKFIDQVGRENLFITVNLEPTIEDIQDVFEQLKERAIYLPTSVTSENAFIVKYAGRTQQEIAKRLIRTSIGTIEHIKPDSLGGANSIDNFMLVSGNANSTRANMPLAKFIERFPNIPKNCQKYINQIIKIIHNGGFKGYETYPYQIKRTLNAESEGGIVLDLSKYKYTEDGALAKAGASRTYKHKPLNL